MKPSILNYILSIGDKSGDSEQEKLQHHFLVAMGLLMSVGGLLWGSICLYFNLFISAMFPLGYIAVTFINLIVFYIFKNFVFSRFIQVLISLFLPYFLQWSLGGFIASGGVMLWAMLSLIGASTFQNARLNLRWLFAYLFLTALSYFIDPYVEKYALNLPHDTLIFLVVMNIFFISAIVFGLNIVFMAKKDILQEQLFKVEKEKAEISSKLSKYLSPQVYNSIFSGKKDVQLESYRKKLTVFFSDIKNFTKTTDSMESESLTALLNDYLNEMSNIAIQYGGTIDKYIGDAIMIFFGDPDTKGEKEDALACVNMAIEMRDKMQDLRKKWADQGISMPLHIRMGMNTGFCTVGNFGSDDRMDYTIIGGQVNLASRLESLAKEDMILISYETYALIKDQIICEKKETYQVKGIAYPVKTFEVKGRIGEVETVRKKITQTIPGLTVILDLNEVAAETAEKELSKIIEQIQFKSESA
ncbi:MAG: adenylate cyclase [Spirochaetia bacterium]|nr:adenylate cyclase [Spirochaetia bacterium]